MDSHVVENGGTKQALCHGFVRTRVQTAGVINARIMIVEGEGSRLQELSLLGPMTSFIQRTGLSGLLIQWLTVVDMAKHGVLCLCTPILYRSLVTIYNTISDALTQLCALIPESPFCPSAG